jgi:hypothetical protein
MGKIDVDSTCGFTASPEVGPRATIGTLQTGYPRIPASSRDKGQGVHPRTAMHPTAPDPASLLGKAPAPPRVLQLQTSPPY